MTAALLDELFDAVVISGLEGIRKPEPRMYALGVERLGLAPGDASTSTTWPATSSRRGRSG